MQRGALRHIRVRVALTRARTRRRSTSRHATGGHGMGAPQDRRTAGGRDRAYAEYAGRSGGEEMSCDLRRDAYPDPAVLPLGTPSPGPGARGCPDRDQLDCHGVAQRGAGPPGSAAAQFRVCMRRRRLL